LSTQIQPSSKVQKNVSLNAYGNMFGWTLSGASWYMMYDATYVYFEAELRHIIRVHLPYQYIRIVAIYSIGGPGLNEVDHHDHSA
jgi:hypothetical protein